MNHPWVVAVVTGLIVVAVAAWFGFEGSAWHTHGDVLTPAFGETDEEAVSGFIHAILDDQLVIGVLPIEGIPSQVYVTNRPDEEIKQRERPPNLVLRYWSGKEFTASKGVRRDAGSAGAHDA